MLAKVKSESNWMPWFDPVRLHWANFIITMKYEPTAGPSLSVHPGTFRIVFNENPFIFITEMRKLLCTGLAVYLSVVVGVGVCLVFFFPLFSISSFSTKLLWHCHSWAALPWLFCWRLQTFPCVKAGNTNTHRGPCLLPACGCVCVFGGGWFLLTFEHVFMGRWLGKSQRCL